MLFQFMTNTFCLSKPGNHILHEVSDLWGQKTTEFPMSLRTLKISFCSLTGREQSWLRSLVAACAQKGHQNWGFERAENPKTALSPSSSWPSLRPPLDFHPLVLHAPHCCQAEALPSGPTGKQNRQNNFPKAGGKRKTIKAPTSHWGNKRAGSATKWTEMLLESQKKFRKEQSLSAWGAGRGPQRSPLCFPSPEMTGRCENINTGVKSKESIVSGAPTS